MDLAVSGLLDHVGSCVLLWCHRLRGVNSASLASDDGRTFPWQVALCLLDGWRFDAALGGRDGSCYRISAGWGIDRPCGRPNILLVSLEIMIETDGVWLWQMRAT